MLIHSALIYLVHFENLSIAHLQNWTKHWERELNWSEQFGIQFLLIAQKVI